MFLINNAVIKLIMLLECEGTGDSVRLGGGGGGGRGGGLRGLVAVVDWCWQAVSTLAPLLLGTQIQCPSNTGPSQPCLSRVAGSK